MASIWRIKSLAYLSENSTCGLHGTTLTSFPYLDTYMSGPCEVFTFVKLYPFAKVIFLTSTSYYVWHSISIFFYLIIVIDYGCCNWICQLTYLNLDIIIHSIKKRSFKIFINIKVIFITQLTYQTTRNKIITLYIKNKLYVDKYRPQKSRSH
jgi:hypothetical protein